MLDAEQIVKDLKCWSDPVQPSRLTGGLSNDNFLVEDLGKKYVVRVNGDVPVHGVLRLNDATCNRAAAEVGVAPSVFFATQNAIVIDFIDGKTLEDTDIRAENMLERVLPLLKRTHIEAFKNIRGPVCAFWPFRVCRDYAYYLSEKDSRAKSDIPYFQEVNDRLEKIIGPITLVLGHNDLLAANVIDDGDRLWLIDWEHAGLSSPLFDLANLSTNNGLSLSQEKWLLGNYFEQHVDEVLERRFQAMKCASLLREAMWSLVSEITATLDFDYKAYSREYLDRFEKEFKQLDG